MRQYKNVPKCKTFCLYSSCGHPVWLLKLPNNMGWFKDHGINCNLCFGYWLMQQFIIAVVILHEDFPSRYSWLKVLPASFITHVNDILFWLVFNHSWPTFIIWVPRWWNLTSKKQNITSSQYYFPGRECKIQVTLSINLSYFVSSLVRAELSEHIHSIFIEEGTWMGFKAVVNFLTSAGDLIACKYSHLGISPYC